MVWVVLSTRQFFTPSGEVQSRAHAIIFTSEANSRAYAARLKENDSRWEVGVGEVPVNEDADTAPLPDPQHKEN